MLLSKRVFDRLSRRTRKRLEPQGEREDKTALPSPGMIRLRFRIQKEKLEEVFVVRRIASDLILGAPFLKGRKCSLDSGQLRVLIQGRALQCKKQHERPWATKAGLRSETGMSLGPKLLTGRRRRPDGPPTPCLVEPPCRLTNTTVWQANPTDRENPVGDQKRPNQITGRKVDEISREVPTEASDLSVDPRTTPEGIAGPSLNSEGRLDRQEVLGQSHTEEPSYQVGDTIKSTPIHVQSEEQGGPLPCSESHTIGATGVGESS